MVVNIERAKAIKGWMAESELLWLAARSAESRVVVEVGSYKGRSTRALADHCPGVVYAVDPWDNYANDDGTTAKWIDLKAAWPQFYANLRDHIDSGKLIVHQGVLSTAPGLYGLKPDMIFIDGDHRYEAVMEDIRVAQRVIRPGGLLCGHDYKHNSWPGVKRAVDEVFQAISLCRSIWWVRA